MALLWTGVWENILDVERKWFFVGGGEREGGRTPTHHACETGMAYAKNLPPASFLNAAALRGFEDKKQLPRNKISEAVCIHQFRFWISSQVL